MARKSLSGSLRWEIFRRDGFCCRYCGAQAGTDGTVLAVDHVVSVAEGGTNAIDNLITACQKCNGGKSARSLSEVPVAVDQADRAAERAASAADLAASVRAEVEAGKEMRQACIDIKCEVYDTDADDVQWQSCETTIAVGLLKEFGADALFRWYGSAFDHDVTEWDAIKYVCGCARNERKERGRSV